MGRAREGGRARFTMGGQTQESTITAWEPGRRLAYRGDENADGTFMAFEYLIEGRDGGSTVLRFVHSGFLGDDWEAEYDALKKGNPMYLCKLAAYVEHFAGRTANATMLKIGPKLPDSAKVWSVFGSEFGFGADPATGDGSRIAIAGLAAADGVVRYAGLPTYVVVSTPDSIHAFMHAQDHVVVEQHSFADDADPEQIEQAWQAWLDRSFA